MMPYDPSRHHRQSVRIRGFGYAAPRLYFVTICTEGRECIFGDVIDGKTKLNEVGRIVDEEWLKTPKIRREVELDDYVVMPNHIHGLVRIVRQDSWSDEPSAFAARVARSVSSLVGGFKAAVTSRVNRLRGTPKATVWQRNFHEHIVRDSDGASAIRSYIKKNPERWDCDADNPQGDGTDDVLAFIASLTSWEEPEDAKNAGSETSADSDNFGSVSSSATLSQQGRSKSANVSLHRIGHGYDLHRLQSGGSLVLAGVEVSRELSPIAHSDGDVVLHAIVDALCGALGLGDIGEHFPNTDPRWKDAPSRTFVEAIYARVQIAGYSIGNVDVTILAERPKLKEFKPAMRRSLAELLHVSIDQVNVKAGTNEGCDAIGRGEAIAAHAVVLLVRTA